ncbi:dihydropteroate synthase [Oscillatoria sp. FACHB-1406]|uniref:dihydropteroate synthase n=1 Tax=Oscillatoria sp. FACHB-1406 TaxID=2692846 RepID=UPI00168710AE|nr:dihydropteroate synthase [Oscillatoria sp. FACHB-1406]MBD2578267.1 dihydropteroate synthase [Oscillatoria sp. FACHB-1406]
MTGERLSLTVRGRSFIWGERTYLMGILNVTPDSFSDGGEFDRVDSALERARTMVASGADTIDIGGQSTRPGAEQINETEELRRVIPVIEALRGVSEIPISVDTTRATVAKAAIAAGADIINDISGGTFDAAMFSTAAELNVPIILMHIRGTPQTMQTLTDYEDLVGEICQFLGAQREKAIAAGIARSQIILDPGIGFAKTYPQNLELLRHLDRFQSLQAPILVGPSRKSFIGHLLDKPQPKERVWGTAAVCCRAIASGADILRIHDVAEMYDVCRVADALFRTPSPKIRLNDLS